MSNHTSFRPWTTANSAMIDFVITQPTAGTQWANGAANVVSWVKGVGDGVDAVDIEMSRLSQDGLTFVAQDGKYSLSSD